MYPNNVNRTEPNRIEQLKQSKANLNYKLINTFGEWQMHTIFRKLNVQNVVNISLCGLLILFFEMAKVIRIGNRSHMICVWYVTYHRLLIYGLQNAFMFCTKINPISFKYVQFFHYGPSNRKTGNPWLPHNTILIHKIFINVDNLCEFIHQLNWHLKHVT